MSTTTVKTELSVRQMLGEKANRFLSLAEKKKEIEEQMELLAEDIQEDYDWLGEDEIVGVLHDGEYFVIKPSHSVRDELDKDGLAQEILVAKDELKTPFDFSILTAQGKLTPDQISKHTDTVTKTKLKISRRKRKPKGYKPPQQP